MIQKALFGAWLPDQPEHMLDGLITARNVYAGPNGYRPVKQFDSVTSAMPDEFRGAASFVGSDGSAKLITGTDEALYHYPGGAWTALETGFSLSGDARWRFAQFGDDVVCVNGGAPHKVNLISSAADPLGGSPPTAEMVTVVRDFVVLGRANGEQNLVQWSGFNDAESWTAGVDQSGFQPMLTGGAVMGLAGGEYGVILQRNAITRMTYTGDEFTFQFDQVASNIGCDAPGSVVQHGNLVFFHSDQGFMLFDGNQVSPIGNEQVDRTFLSSFSRQDLTLIWTAIDPINTLVWWVMPQRVFCYNWVQRKWTEIRTNIKAIFSGYTFNLDMDTDDPEDATDSDIDSDSPSLDDPRYQGGDPLLLGVTPGDVIGAFTGPAMAAVFQMPFVEPVAGRVTRMRRIRPLGDATDGITLYVDHRARLGDVANEAAFSYLPASGSMPTRCAARYHQIRLEITEGTDWSYAQGLELDYDQGGRR